jgi:hypothetical protein
VHCCAAVSASTLASLSPKMIIRQGNCGIVGESIGKQWQTVQQPLQENGMDSHNADEEIRQEDTWDIIRKYFDENGLVQQQRASYDEFIIQNIQEVVDDYKGQIEVVATHQYLPGQQSKGRMKLQVGNEISNHKLCLD